MRLNGMQGMQGDAGDTIGRGSTRDRAATSSVHGCNVADYPVGERAGTRTVMSDAETPRGLSDRSSLAPANYPPTGGLLHRL